MFPSTGMKSKRELCSSDCIERVVIIDCIERVSGHRAEDGGERMKEEEMGSVWVWVGFTSSRIVLEFQNVFCLLKMGFKQGIS